MFDNKDTQGPHPPIKLYTPLFVQQFDTISLFFPLIHLFFIKGTSLADNVKPSVQGEDEAVFLQTGRKAGGRLGRAVATDRSGATHTAPARRGHG